MRFVWFTQRIPSQSLVVQVVPPGRSRGLRDGASDELLSSVGSRTRCSPGDRPGTAMPSVFLLKLPTKLIGQRSLLWDVRQSFLSKSLIFWRQVNSSEKKSIFSHERWTVQGFVVRVHNGCFEIVPQYGCIILICEISLQTTDEWFNRRGLLSAYWTQKFLISRDIYLDFLRIDVFNPSPIAKR
jgi:hypothetical protein